MVNGIRLTTILHLASDDCTVSLSFIKSVDILNYINFKKEYSVHICKIHIPHAE